MTPWLLVAIALAGPAPQREWSEPVSLHVEGTKEYVYVSTSKGKFKYSNECYQHNFRIENRTSETFKVFLTARAEGAPGSPNRFFYRTLKPGMNGDAFDYEICQKLVFIKCSLSAYRPTDPCPNCGCRESHCKKDVPQHLACGKTIEARKKTLETVLKVPEEAKSIDNCNQAIGYLLSALGYMGLRTVNGKPMNADSMYEFLATPKAASDGWRRISGAEIDANAKLGNLVIGVIHSKLYPKDGTGPFQSDYVRVDAKPVPRSADGRLPVPFPLDPAITRNNGHVFAVLPGSTWDKAYNWRDLKIWQAQMGSGKGIHETTAGDAIKRAVMSFVTFYAFTGNYAQTLSTGSAQKNP